MVSASENKLKSQGFEALISSMGLDKAEQFISLILREPLDYIESQKKQCPDKSIEEISKIVMDIYTD